MLQKIENDFKAALKGGDKLKAMTLRMIKSAIINARIAKGQELDEADYLKILQKEAKQRQESIAGFRTAGREAQAEKEEAELKIIEQYLPKALDENEIEQLVADTVAETGAAGAQDMGIVMKALGPKVAGRADGAIVAAKVRQLLK